MSVNGTTKFASIQKFWPKSSGNVLLPAGVGSVINQNKRDHWPSASDVVVQAVNFSNADLAILGRKVLHAVKLVG